MVFHCPSQFFLSKDFELSVSVPDIPTGSNIELVQLKIPFEVNGTSFAVTLICNASEPGFHKTPSALSIDILLKSKLINVKDTS